MDEKVHVLTSDDGQLRSGRLEKEDTFEYTFEEAGTYRVIDTVFGLSMSITVE